MTAYVPPLGSTDFKQIIRSLMQLASGRSNATGIVTLAANASTTTVSDRNCALGSAPLLVPATAHAAAEDGNGTRFVSSVSNGVFVITHANNAQTDRTYLYAIVG